MCISIIENLNFRKLEQNIRSFQVIKFFYINSVYQYTIYLVFVCNSSSLLNVCLFVNLHVCSFKCLSVCMYVFLDIPILPPPGFESRYIKKSEIAFNRLPVISLRVNISQPIDYALLILVYMMHTLAVPAGLSTSELVAVS